MAEGSSIQERISQLKQSQNTVTTRQVDVPQGISGAGEVNNNQANHQQPRHSNFDPTRSKSATSIQSNDSQNRSSYSGLPIGVSTHKSKPSIKPASNVAAYDNRRGMGRSLVGDDEFSS